MSSPACLACGLELHHILRGCGAAFSPSPALRPRISPQHLSGNQKQRRRKEMRLWKEVDGGNLSLEKQH